MNKKFLIINFQRTGDIIQSFHLIFAIKRKYPNSDVYYLTNNIHKNSLFIINDYLKEIFDINYQFIYNNFNENIYENFYYLKLLFNKINSLEFNVVINLNFSLLGAIVTTIINADQKIGCELLSSKKIKIKNKDFAELFSNLENPNYKKNIIEAYLKGCNLFYAKPLLPPYERSCNETNIILHTGASRREKEWGFENFFKLAKLMNSKFENINFFITGSKNEVEKNSLLEEYFKKENLKYKNLTGKLSLLEMFNLLNKGDCFISGDTSIAHLASFTGITSITVFLGNAYHWHTYPYAANKFVVFPDIECYPCRADYNCEKQQCKNKILPDTVLSIIERKNIQTNVLQTYIDNNFVKLKPLKN